MYPQHGPGGAPQHTWSSSPAQTDQPAPGWTPDPSFGTPPEPATALKVFGVLSTVFGGMNLLGNALSIVQLLLQQKQMARMTQGGGDSPFNGGMQDMIDATAKITVGHGIAMILMDIALVAVGVLLLQRKEIGRKLAIVWAGMAFIVLIGRAVSFELVMMPVFDRFMSATTGGSTSQGPFSSGMFSMFARAGTYLSLAFMALFPTAMMIVMNLGSVKRSVRPSSESVMA